MSSYVAKSKKTFQPKAPARRAPASNASSVRDSQGSPRISATPQPGLGDASYTDVDADTASVTAPSLNVAAQTVSASQSQASRFAANRIAATPELAPIIQEDDSTSTPAIDRVSSRKSQGAAEVTATNHTQSIEAPTAREFESTSVQLQHQPVSITPQQESVPLGGQSSGQHHNTQEGASALLQLSQADVRERVAPERPVSNIASTTIPHSGEVNSENTPSAETAPSKKKKGGRKRKSVADEPDNNAEDETVEEATDAAAGPSSERPRKRQRASKTTKQQPRAKPKPKAKKTQTVHEAEAEAIVADSVRPKNKRKRAVPETAADEEEDGDSSEIDEAQKLRRKRREPTPEDAEQTKINPNVVTMAELETVKTGVRSTREAKLRERDEEERARKQADAEIQERIDSYEDGNVPEDDEEALEYLERKREEQEQEDAKQREKERIFQEQQEWTYKPSGRYGAKRKTDTGLLPTEAEDAANSEEDHEVDYEASERPGATMVVDGQIVANPNYRVRETDTYQVAKDKQITDISHRVHEGSFRHKAQRFKWTELTIERFYEGLRAFGMDFGMIATIIPGASRMHVKSLWKKEEKNNTAKINEALLPKSRRAMAISEIEQIRGTTLKDPKEWEKEKDRREQALRDEKEQARLDAEAELRGPAASDQDEGGAEAIDYEKSNDQANGTAASPSGSGNDDDDPSNGPNGLVNSIEDLDDDGIVRSAETDTPEPEAAKHGGKSRATASKKSGRGRGRGRGRANGAVRGSAG